MGKVETLKENRFKYLNLLWEITDGNIRARGNSEDLGLELGFSNEETEKIVQYLIDEYLIKRAGLSNLIEITHEGLKEIEEALSNPDEETHYFPAVNVINIDHMEGSQIQQGTISSTQSGTFRLKNRNEFNNFIKLLKEQLPEITLSSEDESEITLDISTIESQIDSSRPKPGIMKECLLSIQRILEGAAGGVTAQQLATYIPALLAALN